MAVVCAAFSACADECQTLKEMMHASVIFAVAKATKPGWMA